MKEKLLVVAVILLVVALGGLFLFLPKQSTRVYNCTWAEISPDMPLKVKEECRKRNIESSK
jgi:hypothetical protein